MVLLSPDQDGVSEPSCVSLDNLQSMRTEWLEDRITELSSSRMREVEAALHFALALST
jgi:mRNA-degrading endonuclease toxin of MazEF toxin-antitoxin module